MDISMKKYLERGKREEREKGAKEGAGEPKTLILNL